VRRRGPARGLFVDREGLRQYPVVARYPSGPGTNRPSEGEGPDGRIVQSDAAYLPAFSRMMATTYPNQPFPIPPPTVLPIAVPAYEVSAFQQLG
jgi:hypothetical protein